MTKGQNGGEGGVGSAANHLLQSDDNMRCDEDGIGVQVGHGGMPSFTTNRKSNFIGGGHVTTAAKSHSTRR